jgi:hypothetical protein
MEVRNDLVCHGSHTYTYSVATRLSRPNKEKAPAWGDRGLRTEGGLSGFAGYTFCPVSLSRRRLGGWLLVIPDLT